MEPQRKKPRTSHSVEQKRKKPQPSHSVEPQRKKPQTSHSVEQKRKKHRTSHSVEQKRKKSQTSHSVEPQRKKPRTSHSVEHNGKKPRTSHSVEHNGKKPRTSHSVEQKRKKRRTSHRVEHKRKKPRTSHSVVNSRDFYSECLENYCIQRKIFGYLSTGDKVVAARVCKQWRDIIYQPGMWLNKNLCIDMDEVDMRIMAPSLKRRNITRLRLHNDVSLATPCDAILWDATKFLLLMCSLGPIIKSLDMKRCSARINEEILERACNWKTLPCLESLHLSYTTPTCARPTSGSIKVICERCPGLKSLQMNNCDNLTDSTLTLVGQKLTALTDLDITMCKSFTDAGLYNISTCLSHLTALTVDGSYITNTGVSHLTKFPLRKLSMSLCCNINEDCINALLPLRNSLQGLNISQCPNVNPNIALHHIANSEFCLTEFAVGYNGLFKSLNIGNAPDMINEVAIKYFLKKKAGRQLKKLQVEGKLENSALMAASIEKNCPELNILIIEKQNVLGCKLKDTDHFRRLFGKVISSAE